jgi:flagellar biosynthetic protein FlhB
VAEQDQDQKTEEPTGKRLDEARERGQLPISREMSTWTVFVGVLLVVAYLGAGMARDMLAGLRVFMEMPHAINLEGPGFQTALAGIMVRRGLATVLVFGVLFAAAVLGTGLQTGFYATTERLNPDFSRVSPLHGLKRLFSKDSLAELLKSIVKLVVIIVIMGFVFAPLMDILPLYAGRSLTEVLGFLHREAVHVIVILMLIITLIAVADLLYQRFTYFRNLRMTRQEIRDEHKQMEGDPMIKSRLRGIRLEKARKRMMAQVPKADVVVTNPTHYAVALQYDGMKMAAPVVVAKGADRIALRIREVADEHAVPLVSNPPLARALYDTVDVDQAVTPQHYRAVAEVISYVYKLKKKVGR